jgi:hypothetical protein
MSYYSELILKTTMVEGFTFPFGREETKRKERKLHKSMNEFGQTLV